MHQRLGWIGLALVLASCSGSSEPIIALEDLDRDYSADIAEAHFAREDHILECMASLGFDYEVAELDEDLPFSFWPRTISREQAESIGYGFASSFLSAEDTQDVPSPKVEKDETYLEALDGPLDDGAEGDGCRGSAEQAIPEIAALSEPDLQAAMADLIDRAEASDSYTKASRDWAACMADAGFELSSHKDLLSTLIPIEQELLATVDYADLGPEGLPSFDQEIWQRLRDEEMALAQADILCSPALFDALKASAVDLNS